MLKTAIPIAPSHQDVHKSVSPVLAAWGPGIVYSRIFRYRWIEPEEPNYGTDALVSRYDPRKSASAYEIICDICNYWELNDDLTLSIKIRSGVEWHETNPGLDRTLTADDVVYSLDRLNDPTLANSHLVNTVADIRSVGDDTVEIDLMVPDAEIFDKLADARTAIVAPEVVNFAGDLTQGPTIGTGPWVLESFDADRMRYRGNDQYFIPGLPLLDGIDVAIIEDSRTRVVSLRTGQLDFIQPDVADLAAAVERFSDLRWTSTHDPAAGVEVAFNTTKWALESTTLRSAIMYSWDPVGLIDDIHSGQSFVSAGLPLNDPSWLLTSTEIETYFNDRSELSNLLDGLRLPRGIILKISVGEFGDAYLDTAVSLADAIQRLGLIASVEAVSTRDFAEDIWLYGGYDIYVGAPPPQSSASSRLLAVYHSAGPWNTTGYSTPELDDLIALQVSEVDPIARRELMLEIQREIFRGAYMFMAGAQVSHWLWWSHLRNVAPNTFRADSFWLTRLWLGERIRG